MLAFVAQPPFAPDILYYMGSCSFNLQRNCELSIVPTMNENSTVKNGKNRRQKGHSRDSAVVLNRFLHVDLWAPDLCFTDAAAAADFPQVFKLRNSSKF
jgi:hypothetical protein